MKTKKAKSSKGLSIKPSKSTINSASTDALTPESRKRKLDGIPGPEDDTASASSKKPLLGSASLANGVKRSLEAEVR